MVCLLPTLKAQELGTLIPEVRGNGCPSSGRESKFAFPLCLFSPLMNQMIPAHIGEKRSYLFSLKIKILISFRKTHTNTPRNNVLLAIQASLSTVKLMHKINLHRMDPKGQMVAIWKIVSFQQSLESIYEISIV